MMKFFLIALTILGLTFNAFAEAIPPLEVTLAPGDGTILLLGSEKDLEAVKQEYFGKNKPSSPSKPSANSDKSYRLDFMPFGFYLGDVNVSSYKDIAAAQGLDVREWYGRLLDMLCKDGANTIYVQGGGALEGSNGQLPAKIYAEFAAQHGFRVIYQPNDVFFYGSHHFQKGSKLLESYPKGAEDYFQRVLKPRLQNRLPIYREGSKVFAWSPGEEVAVEEEALFTQCKKLLRELVPGQLHFQLDSQQSTYETLKSKQPPYPDIFGFDRYCWWAQPSGENLCLWTPHYATRWLYNVMKTYAEAVHKLYQRQSIAVLQGPAEFSFSSLERGAKYGWQPKLDYRCPSTPGVSYYPKHNSYGHFNRYFPPPNAERLSTWITLCAGHKGVMLWSALAHGPEKVREFIEAGPKDRGEVRLGIIHYDLTTTPQYEELMATWRAVKPLEKLILALQPAETAFASSEDKHLFLNSFVDAQGRKYLMIVNGLIGEWDKDSPDWLNYPRTQLSVGMDGNLINYTPLSKPRAIALKLKEDGATFNLRDQIR